MLHHPQLRQNKASLLIKAQPLPSRGEEQRPVSEGTQGSMAESQDYSHLSLRQKTGSKPHRKMQRAEARNWKFWKENNTPQAITVCAACAGLYTDRGVPPITNWCSAIGSFLLKMNSSLRQFVSGLYTQLHIECMKEPSPLCPSHSLARCGAVLLEQ